MVRRGLLVALEFLLCGCAGPNAPPVSPRSLNPKLHWLFYWGTANPHDLPNQLPLAPNPVLYPLWVGPRTILAYTSQFRDAVELVRRSPMS